MVDIHNHILYGIDDGPTILEESLEMARIISVLGIKQIIATPHYLPGLYETPYLEIKEKVEQFNKKLAQNKIPIEVYPGQEVRLTMEMIEQYKQGQIGTLNEKNYMLVELPYEKLKEEDYRVIEKLKDLGISPVIAHIERYSLKRDHREALTKLRSKGCYFQMNSDNLMGLNGFWMKKWCQRLIKKQVIDVFASDAHSAIQRNSGLMKGYQCISSKERISVLKKNAVHILEGGKLV